MCPGCDIALGMQDAAAAQHPLATLVEDAARTPLVPGFEPNSRMMTGRSTPRARRFIRSAYPAPSGV